VSITTKRGDGGETSLVGGIRVSKGDLRVEAYGTIDELNAALGFARSICTNAELSSWTRDIQKTLFHIGSALATVPESQKGAAPLAARCGLADGLGSRHRRQGRHSVRLVLARSPYRGCRL
jgi:cob(I)alamin adenosyltransferase